MWMHKIWYLTEAMKEILSLQDEKEQTQVRQLGFNSLDSIRPNKHGSQ